MLTRILYFVTRLLRSSGNHVRVYSGRRQRAREGFGWNLSSNIKNTRIWKTLSEWISVCENRDSVILNVKWFAKCHVFYSLALKISIWVELTFLTNNSAASLVCSYSDFEIEKYALFVVAIELKNFEKNSYSIQVNNFVLASSKNSLKIPNRLPVQFNDFDADQEFKNCFILLFKISL